jgi:hypothetical protein
VYDNVTGYPHIKQCVSWRLHSGGFVCSEVLVYSHVLLSFDTASRHPSVDQRHIQFSSPRKPQLTFAGKERDWRTVGPLHALLHLNSHRILSLRVTNGVGSFALPCGIGRCTSEFLPRTGRWSNECTVFYSARATTRDGYMPSGVALHDR